MNTYRFEDNICIGTTSNGKEFIFDIDKYDMVKNYNWHIDSKGYVRTNHNRKQIRLHNLIMQDVWIDHINLDRADNRVENLRKANPQQNQCNKKGWNKLNVKGVTKHRNKYMAQIQKDNKLIYIGLFSTIKEASDAYDKKARELFGEFARLNNYQ